MAIVNDGFQKTSGPDVFGIRARRSLICLFLVVQYRMTP
jgi:hypothetical protein